MKNDDSLFERSIVRNITYYDKSNLLSKIYRVIKNIIFNPLKYIKIFKWTLKNLGNCTIYDLFRKIRHLHIGFYLSDFISKTNYDYLYTHWRTGITISAVVNQLTGIKYSICLHANEIYTERQIDEWKFSNTTEIIVNNTYNKYFFNLITDYQFENKIKVIRNIPPNIDKKFFPRKKVGTPINLLCLGRLIHFKDHPTLLSACKILLENEVEFRLVIGGDGNTYKLIDSLAKEMKIDKYIQMIGKYDENDVWELFENSDILIHASGIGSCGTRDGLPNVIIEAMMACLPVISTYVSSIPEAIDNEVDGLLIPEKDPQSLYDAINRLNSDQDLYQHISRNSAIKAQKIFNKSNTVKLLKEMFNQI